MAQDLRAALIRWCADNQHPALQADGTLATTPVANLPPAEFDIGRLGWRRH